MVAVGGRSSPGTLREDSGRQQRAAERAGREESRGGERAVRGLLVL